MHSLTKSMREFSHLKFDYCNPGCHIFLLSVPLHLYYHLLISLLASKLNNIQRELQRLGKKNGKIALI